jgi:hypothetical protein
LPPEGPLPHRPPDHSAWRISYEYPEDKLQKKPGASSPALPPAPANSMSMAKPRQITLTFDRPLWHAVIANVDGRTNDEWSDGAIQYVKPDGNLGVMVVPPVNPGTDHYLVPNFGKDPFSDMAWASRGTYTGTEAVEGHKCFVFKKDDMTAWIDAVSLYPVQWQRGDEMRKYLSLPDPGGLTLPTEFQKVAQDYQRYRKMTTRPPPSGG